MEDSQNYKYRSPVNFNHNNPEFDIFKNLPTQHSSPTYLVEYKNVRISNNSIIFNYFNIVKESCLGEGVLQHSQSYRFYLKYIFPKINFYKNKTFILITDQWTANYYHWHIFSLIKLIFLKKNNLTEDS